MTGEITLRGKVLPVGGIKEKILAAKRSGIKEIILSEKNKRDIDEIEKTYIKGLTFHYVTSVEEVLKIALLKDKGGEAGGVCACKKRNLKWLLASCYWFLAIELKY
jgi:ATP-dependent Lon protease